MKILFFILLASTIASGSTPLPYTVRTFDYSGWTAATQSDINTTGIAGATVALPSSISSAESNPAGFAMETGSLSAVYNQVGITDLRIQPGGDPIKSFQWGASVSPPPWGFALTYYSPITEAATYNVQNIGDVNTEVSVRELRFTASRVFLESHLALGLSAEVVTAIRSLGSYNYNSSTLSYKLGALYKLPEHFILGLGFTPELSIGPSSNPDQTLLPGFNRAVWRPGQLDLGGGWVPNRFFKAGAQLSYISPTPNTALLSDQQIITGAKAAVIPRLGASYVLADFNHVTSVLALGAYYEASRLQGQDDRFHGTAGFEINPYFVNLGIGLDVAADYHNVIFGVGIDLVRTARFFSIVPDDPTPPYKGFFPRADTVSAEGLSPQFTKGEPRTSSPESLDKVKKIIKDVPENIADKFSGKPTTVEKAKKKKKLKKQIP